MAYSAGFNPHPKISYANAAPTGTASLAEYVEIGLIRKQDPQQLIAALADAMPSGLRIVDAVEAVTPDLVSRLEAGKWLIELPGLTPAAASAAIETFLAASEILVTRSTKNGPRTFDCRAAVLNCELETPEKQPAYAILRLVIRQLTPAVRPDDVLNGISQVAQLGEQTARVTRLAQGPLTDDGKDVTDPLAADRQPVQGS